MTGSTRLGLAATLLGVAGSLGLLTALLLLAALNELDELIEAAVVNANGAGNDTTDTSSASGGVARAEAEGTLRAASLELLGGLGNRHSVVGKLGEPVLGLLGVLILRTQEGLEDVVTLAHAVDGLLSVLVEGKGLSKLEEESSRVNGLLAEDLVAHTEGLLEPTARLVVGLDALQHDGIVVHGGDSIGMVRSIDDLPEIQSMSGVEKSLLAVTTLVEEQREVEVVQHSLRRVETDGTLGNDGRLAGQLNGGILLAQLVIELRQSVVHLSDLGVDKTIDLLMQREGLEEEILAELLLVLVDGETASLESLLGKGATGGRVLDDGNNVDEVVRAEGVGHGHNRSGNHRGSLTSRLLLLLLLVAILNGGRGGGSGLLGSRLSLALGGNESVLLVLNLQTELLGNLAEHLDVLELVEPALLQSEPEAVKDLLLHSLPQSLRGDLLEAVVGIAEHLAELLINLGDRGSVKTEAQEAVEEVSQAGRSQRKRQVPQVLGSDVLESSGDHLTNAELAEALDAATLRKGSELTEVTHVDTAAVEEAGERTAIHGEADVGLLKIVQKRRDDRVTEVGAGVTDVLLILGHLGLLLLSLRNLAAEDIGVQGKLEVADIDALILLGSLLLILLLGNLGGLSSLLGLLSLLSLGLLGLGLLRLLTLLGLGLLSLSLLGGLLALLLLLGLLDDSALQELSLDIFPGLLLGQRLNELGAEHGHAVRVLRALRSALLHPGNIQGSDAVQVQNVLASISSEETLHLNTGLEVVALVLLVPNGVLLDAEGSGELLERRSEALISGNDVLAVNSTVVNLVLTSLGLLEDARNDTLADNALTEIIDNNSAGSVETVNVELVHELDTENILASGNAGSLITTLAGESANTISAEGEEDVVVDEDLGILVLSRVKRSDLAASDKDGTAGSGISVVSKELSEQTLPEDAILDGLLGKLLGRLELFVPIPQRVNVLSATEQVGLLRAGVVGLVSSEGRVVGGNQPGRRGEGVADLEGGQGVLLARELLELLERLLERRRKLLEKGEERVRGAILGGGLGERVELGVAAPVDEETTSMGGNVVLLTLVGLDDEVQKVALLPPVGRRGVPWGQRDGLDGLGSGAGLLGEQDGEVGGGLEVVLLDLGLGGIGVLDHNIVVNGNAGKNAVNGVGAVSGSADQLANADEVNAGLLLGVGVLDNM